MRYFQTEQNVIRAVDAGQEFLIKEEWVEVTEQQMALLLTPPGPTPEQIEAQIDAARRAAYTAESDPLFFKWQAGEATQEQWTGKRDEIRQRFPKE